ncbi:hypothetical protein ABZ543_34480 [Streptomyces roseifaciens]
METNAEKWARTFADHADVEIPGVAVVAGQRRPLVVHRFEDRFDAMKVAMRYLDHDWEVRINRQRSDLHVKVVLDNRLFAHPDTPGAPPALWCEGR